MTQHQTPRFGWPAPNDDEFVRQGADAMRTLADAIDASIVTGNTSGTWAGNTATVSFGKTFSAPPVVVFVNGDWHATPATIHLAWVSTTGFAIEKPPGTAGGFWRVSFIAVGRP